MSRQSPGNPICLMTGPPIRANLVKARTGHREKAGQQILRGETIMATTEPTGAIEVASIEDTSLLAFYRDMNAPERHTFWACASGWALDGMDFQIYPLVVGTIITLWKVDPGTAGLPGTVTLFTSAVAGCLPASLSHPI